MAKKLSKKTVGCETCKFRKGEIYEVGSKEKIVKAYCTARHIDVDVELMNKFCDHFSMKEQEY